MVHVMVKPGIILSGGYIFCKYQWENWLLLGDFNFIRSIDNRNLPGGDLNDMFIFNEIIGHLGLLELPIKGRSYTWSNMQDTPLLEQLDWFFYFCRLDF